MARRGLPGVGGIAQGRDDGSGSPDLHRYGSPLRRWGLFHFGGLQQKARRSGWGWRHPGPSAAEVPTYDPRHYPPPARFYPVPTAPFPEHRAGFALFVTAKEPSRKFQF